MNEEDKNDTWKAFMCCVILLAAVWELYGWYGQNYCEDTAIPVLCSKE